MNTQIDASIPNIVHVNFERKSFPMVRKSLKIVMNGKSSFIKLHLYFSFIVRAYLVNGHAQN